MPVTSEPQTNDGCPDIPFSENGCPVAVIGASAGGLEVLGQFFEHAPVDSGITFIVARHLERSHDTLMPELLAKHTRMPVHKVVEAVKIEPNQVYVLASSSHWSLQGHNLAPRKSSPSSTASLIDEIFRSAAEARRDMVAGIVLSGWGTDGTLGLKTIKERGGLTVAQKPETAKHDGMPRSAVESG